MFNYWFRIHFKKNKIEKISENNDKLCDIAPLLPEIITYIRCTQPRCSSKKTKVTIKIQINKYI